MLRYRKRAKITMCEQRAWYGFRVGANNIRYSVHMPKLGAMTFTSGKIHLFNLKVSERMPQVKYGFECLKQ